MKIRELRIVLAGEVDCGKSTLIGRLIYDTNSIPTQAKKEFERLSSKLNGSRQFAYLLDSLKEEREEEFTLDTTQAAVKFRKKTYLFIDVPGHRQLIRNMLTGTSSADCAVLVVNATKALEEQTRRHLYILRFLGIKKVVVAVNKMDLIGYDSKVFWVIKNQLAEFLKELGAYSKHVVPVCAMDGENLIARSSKMKWHKGLPLIKVLDELKVEKKKSGFCFVIQDIYTIKSKTVLVGPIVSGRITKNESVKVSPEGEELKIKEILVFNKGKLTTKAPESVGLVVDKIIRFRRGQLFYKGKPPLVTNKIRAKLFCLDSIGYQTKVTFNCATQSVSCRIGIIEERVDTATLNAKKGKTLLAGLDAADVVINTQEYISVEKFSKRPFLGRFVVKKGESAVAVGIIN